MCLSNVYENSVEQKNLILSNVQRIDCKDGFVVLYDLFDRETRVEGRLATIDLVGNTAVIVVLTLLIVLMIAATAFLIYLSVNLVNKQPEVAVPQGSAVTLPQTVATTPTARTCLRCTCTRSMRLRLRPRTSLSAPVCASETYRQ